MARTAAALMTGPQLPNRRHDGQIERHEYWSLPAGDQQFRLPQFLQGSRGFAKLTFDSGMDRLRVIARGRVESVSCDSQEFEDAGILPCIGVMIRDDDLVSVQGRAECKGQPT